jgi:hypothetical protein
MVHAFGSAGQMFDRRDDRVGLDFLDEIGRRVLTEIDTGPTRHEDERAVVGRVTPILIEFGSSFLVGLSPNRSRPCASTVSVTTKLRQTNDVAALNLLGSRHKKSPHRR